MPIQLFDCAVGPDEISNLSAVLQSGQLASGVHVPALEKELSERVDGRPIVVVNDVTHALAIALELAGVDSTSEVLALSFNCLSSTSAIKNLGATPVWIDIDPETASVNLEDIVQKITKKTRAIVVYHVAGYPADTTALRFICTDYGLTLIEDANNALGAILPDGGQAGSVGDYSVFSFYANRQVNGIEGAALVCPDNYSADQARKLRKFGIDQSKFRDVYGEIDSGTDIPIIGYSASMSNVNAALARSNLELLDRRQAAVRQNAAWMMSAIASIPGIQPVRPIRHAIPAYWTLLLLSDKRDRLLSYLKSQGIASSKLHQPNDIYSGFKSKFQLLPGTKFFTNALIAIPCGWWVDTSDREFIVECINHIQTK